MYEYMCSKNSKSVVLLLKRHIPSKKKALKKLSHKKYLALFILVF